MKKFIFATIATSVALCAAGLAGCDSAPQGTDAEYYLSTGQTYSAAAEVPAGYLFQKGDAYTLTLSLEEGTQFTVKEIGGEALGWSAVLSSRTELSEGTNGAILVGETGSYALRLDVTSAPVITYTFTPAQTVDEGNVTSVRFTRLRAKMETGSSEQFTAVAVLKDGSETSELNWTSSNEEVATVSASGLVTALKAGSVNITAEKEGKSAVAPVTVVGDAYIAATGITVTPKTLTLEKGATSQLSYTLEPANASSIGMLWTTSNEAVVSVSESGLVTAVSYGEARITATTRSGYTSSCTVTVRRPVTSVSMESALTLVAGGSPKTVIAHINPTNATVKDYTAEVTAGGEHVTLQDQGEGYLRLTGVSEGEATVTVTSADNPEAVATCTVTVLAANSVSADLSVRELTLSKGGVADVEALLDGEEITSVTWTAGEGTAATISPSQDGMTCTVTGVSFGTVTLTATVNGKYTATCNVLVTSEYFYLTGGGTLADTEKGWDLVGSSEEAEQKDRLLSETDRGVYSVTRRFEVGDAFQIVFPDLDTEWESAIIYDGYYQEDGSVSGLGITKTTDWKNAVFTYSGVYTVELDLTQTAPTFTIIAVSIDIESVSISLATGASSVLEVGKTETTNLTVAITPSGATFEGEIEWWAEQDYAEWFSLTPDGNKCTVKLLTDKITGSVAVSVRIHCSVGGQESHYDIAVVPQGAVKGAVTQVRFLKSNYVINMTDGTRTVQVSAMTNSTATNRMVTYSNVDGKSDRSSSIDSTTGVLTVKYPGVYRIKATSVDDPSVSAVTEVVAYSDTFYLSGVLEGQILWESVNSAKFGFTKVTEKEFKLENAFFKNLDRFKIAFIGIDATWTGAITYNSFDEDNSTKAAINNDSAVMLMEAGYYDITLKLGVGNSFTVEKVGDAPTPDDSYDVKVDIYTMGTGYHSIVSKAGTFHGAAETNSISLTIPKGYAIKQAALQFVVKIEGIENLVWYHINSIITVTGSKVTTSRTENMWVHQYSNGIWSLWYNGDSMAEATTFTLNFTGNAQLVSITID